MSDLVPVARGVAIPRSEFRWRFSRSSGPGGQSVNTADSRVELRWSITDSVALTEAQRGRALEYLAGRLIDGSLVIVAAEHRAQLRNRQAAETRLVALVAAALAPPAAPRRPTRPTRGSVRARLDSKRRRSALKQQRRSDRDE